MKNSKVTVVLNSNTNLLISPNPNKEDHGSIELFQHVLALRPDSNYVAEEKRRAWLNGPLDVLTQFGYKEGQTLPGKIINVQSFNPFYEGQDVKRYPEGHEMAGEPVLTNGKETYFRRLYTYDMNDMDKWVENSDNAIATPESTQPTESQVDEQAI